MLIDVYADDVVSGLSEDRRAEALSTSEVENSAGAHHARGPQVAVEVLVHDLRIPCPRHTPLTGPIDQTWGARASRRAHMCPPTCPGCPSQPRCQSRPARAMPLVQRHTPTTKRSLSQGLGYALIASVSVSVPHNHPSLLTLIDRLVRRVLGAVGRSDASAGSEDSTSEGQSDRETAPPAGAETTVVEAPAVEMEAAARGATTDHRVRPDPSDFARELKPGQLRIEQGTVTRLLHERLSHDDVTQVEQMIRESTGAWEQYSEADDDAARRLLLALGIWLGAEPMINKTGLIRAEPPDDVHAMTRGAWAAAGGLYEADLIVDALLGVGVEMSSVQSALDLGCSSGRVVRALAAAYPQIKWRGCDPNRPAIEWASANLPAIEFFVNDDSPPLPLADASLDLAYAISIWSHFAPALGLRWFEEMRRVIAPGGYLLCTTHGLTSVAHYALLELRQPDQSQEIADSLYRKGWWYAAEFGEEGDWGVVNPDWGTAFISPEWLLAQLCPRWRVLAFAPGRNQGNQDVYVLQRA
jgi:SAM-dependent methyltransferase